MKNKKDLAYIITIILLIALSAQFYYSYRYQPARQIEVYYNQDHAQNTSGHFPRRRWFFHTMDSFPRLLFTPLEARPDAMSGLPRLWRGPLTGLMLFIKTAKKTKKMLGGNAFFLYIFS